MDSVAPPRGLYALPVEEPIGPGTEPPAARPVPLAWLAAVLLVLALPLLVALAVQRDPRWHPSGDSAQIELRVRDVFSTHPPLLGLGGRIGGSGTEKGSHPGPLSFYAMAPVHRLLGDTAWGLQVATAALHVAALGTSLWLARRRGGPGLVLGTAAVLALVVAAYTAEVLTVPWNPYLPLLWLPAFLLAVWSVTCDDLVALPVAAFAGSLCAQTHVPYAGVVGAGAVVVAVWVAGRLVGHEREPGDRRRVLGAVGVAAGVALLVWLPPLLEQLGSDEGNLARVYDYFTDPPGDLLGVGDGGRLLLARLDPWRLLTERDPEAGFARYGSPVPGALLLGAWAVSVVVAWRLRAGALLRLDAVVAAALVAAVLALSRIFGPPFGYLSLWGICLAGLVLLSLGWTVALVVGRALGPGRGERVLRGGAALAAAVAVVALGAATARAASSEPTEPEVSALLGGVLPATLSTLRAGELPGTGDGGVYRVTASDPVYLGFPVHGLIDELDRAGMEVGSDEVQRVAITRHRVLEPGEETAEVHFAVGPAIEEAGRQPDAIEIARFDPRSRRERARWEEARDEAVQRLQEAGAPDLAERVEEVALISGDPRVDPTTRSLLDELRETGVPAAVFLRPADGG